MPEPLTRGQRYLQEEAQLRREAGIIDLPRTPLIPRYRVRSLTELDLSEWEIEAMEDARRPF